MHSAGAFSPAAHDGATTIRALGRSPNSFFEIGLPAVLNLSGHNEGLFALTEVERRHALKVFALVFRREAFVPGARTFHQRAIAEGRFYEERVAASLSDLVFRQVFPGLARAISAAESDVPLPEVREAALLLLYRLLFIFYAEDRDLLPDKVRGDVGRRKDQGDVFSETAARYWSVVTDLCRAIDQGDVAIGLPPYNGGLFDRERAPLLDRIRLGDRVIADVIDALSFEQGPTGRRYINYRDLGVRQLGSIYERLLEHELVRDGDGVAVRPNIFARKGSGSYYTPDDLVGLIVEETIEPLVRARMDAFEAEAGRMPADGPQCERAVVRLAALDPAEKILEFKVCDPAMGSGHFLVSLVDYLADGVIAAMAEAEALVEGYVSPLVSLIQAIRDRIVANAEERAWVIDRDRLDDRHIVRRMVLKRCVYGVDKNPMEVELVKVALWLRTFTVGAPLSFLDHHLRCGDSLFRRMGTGRGRQGDRVWQPVASARLCHPGGTCRAGNADYRGVDRRRDRRGAPLRRDPLRQVCAGRPAAVRVQPRRASHSAAIHTGRLSTTAATTIASGPSNSSSSDAATVTVPSAAPMPQAARRNPSHDNRRHASASGRPQGATTISEGAAINTIGNHIPVISDGVLSGMKRNAVVVTTPTGSQSSASGQNPRRLVDPRSFMPRTTPRRSVMR